MDPTPENSPSVQPEKSVKSPDDLFNQFKEEVQKLKGEESIHLSDVNPEELTPEDMAMRNCVKEYKRKTISELNESYNTYRNEATRSGIQSRISFSAYLGNKLTPLLDKKRKIEEAKRLTAE